MRRFVIADPDKCKACGICEFICSMINENLFNPRASRIRVVKIDPAVGLALACRMCERPPCVVSCVRKALRADEVWGTIKVDEERCNGCGWCIEACEFGTIMLHPDKKFAIVCDLCKGDPKCVEICPLNALKFTTLEAFEREVRREAVTGLFEGKK